MFLNGLAAVGGWPLARLAQVSFPGDHLMKALAPRSQWWLGAGLALQGCASLPRK